MTTEKDWVKVKTLWHAAPDALPLHRLGLQIRFWENEEPPLKGMILAGGMGAWAAYVTPL